MHIYINPLKYTFFLNQQKLYIINLKAQVLPRQCIVLFLQHIIAKGLNLYTSSICISEDSKSQISPKIVHHPLPNFPVYFLSTIPAM